MRSSFASLCLAVACATAPAAAPSGLYALSASTALYRRGADGSWSPVGAPLPYAQAQQLSCVDAARGLLYLLGYDESTSVASVVGVRLADGSVASVTPTPFVDKEYVGIGQYIASEPASGDIFVGGQDAAGDHLLLRLAAPGGGAAGNATLLANLTSSYRDVFGGTSAFVPATGELWFELDLDIMILNVSSGALSVLPVSANFSILGMNLDAASGHLIGLDGGPGQGVRTVVALDPLARDVTVTGSVPAYAMQMGGMTAYDASAKTVFWVAQATGAPADAPWFLVQNRADGGATVTAEPVCAAGGGFCPWSIHFYNAP